MGTCPSPAAKFWWLGISCTLGFSQPYGHIACVPFLLPNGLFNFSCLRNSCSTKTSTQISHHRGFCITIGHARRWSETTVALDVVEKWCWNHNYFLNLTGEFSVSDWQQLTGKWLSKLPISIIAFLLTNTNGTLATTEYRKQTHTDQLLNCHSNHPNDHKRSYIRTLFRRAKTHWSTGGLKSNKPISLTCSRKTGFRGISWEEPWKQWMTKGTEGSLGHKSKIYQN